MFEITDMYYSCKQSKKTMNVRNKRSGTFVVVSDYSAHTQYHLAFDALIYFFFWSAHAQSSSSSSHIQMHYKFGSTHAEQASVNLVHCSHMFATTHLCEKIKFSAAEML
jgi:hypothetical protein